MNINFLVIEEKYVHTINPYTYTILAKVSNISKNILYSITVTKSDRKMLSTIISFIKKT